jgi:hypothetical protein
MKFRLAMKRADGGRYLKQEELMLHRTLAIVCILMTLGAKAAKAPGLPPGDMFFTMKGQPFALERTFPGVVAALMLSDDQKKALNEVYQQTVASPQLREKGAALKGNAAATDADRQAVRSEMETARNELGKKVDPILTPEQKELIKKIQAAAEQAQKTARETLGPEFTAAGKSPSPEKAKELREKLNQEAEDQFVQELQKILTPAQMEAVSAAATAQRAAEEEGRNKKLGK